MFDASWNPCHDVQAVCRCAKTFSRLPVENTIPSLPSPPTRNRQPLVDYFAYSIHLSGEQCIDIVRRSEIPITHDLYRVFHRVYRYGQLKPVHIYRLISTGTMEKKIYDRQISKQGMASK